MSHFGDTIGHIAERLSCSSEVVVRIRHEYRQRGLETLKPEKPPGRPSRAIPEYIAAMKEAIATNPQGYGFSTGSTKRLAAYLKKIAGIGFSDDQLSRLLRRHGYSVQRPKHTMKGKRDEVAYQQAAEELERLKKKLHRHGYSVTSSKHTMKGKRDGAAYQQAAKGTRTFGKKGSSAESVGAKTANGLGSGSTGGSPLPPSPSLRPGKLRAKRR